MRKVKRSVFLELQDIRFY